MLLAGQHVYRICHTIASALVEAFVHLNPLPIRANNMFGFN